MSEAIYSNIPPDYPSQPPGCQEFEIYEKKALSEYWRGDLPPPPLWKITAVILGIICLVLLLSIGLLAPKWNQNSAHPGNISCYMEANKAVTQNSFNEEGHPGSISYDKEANKRDWNYPACSMDWHQSGNNCYFLSRSKNLWKHCPSYCTGLISNFLKMDTARERDFVMKLSKIQCDVFEMKFFISVYYNSTQLKWVWLDGTDFTLDKLPIPGHENAGNKCAHIKYGEITTDNCQIKGYCICKKKIYSNHINT